MVRLILAATLVTVTAPLAAQGWIDVERVASTPTQVRRTSSNVQVTVDGRVARIEVEEHFRNTGGSIAAGTYLYPLPGEAVFENFSLWMGGEEIRGEMLPADEAREIYEEIVRRLKDPALLTLEDHGLIRARVFPIQPGETRKVVLRYTQVLERSGDALRLRYAIGNRDRGPRPAPGGGDDRIFRDDFDFKLDIRDAGQIGTPYSPTHEINTDREGNRLRISLDPDASGDVELFIPYRRGLVGTSVVTHATPGEDGYFMLLVAPPADGNGTAIPRDVTLVVDVSGSMSGGKLEQAKDAIKLALGTLNPRDRFSVVTFSSGVQQFREDLTPATQASVAAAREFVDGLVASGGTNISGALDRVLEAAPAEGRLSLVVFMTDGLPSVGERSPEQIAADVAGRIGERRLFTFGVGHDVNTWLLDRLAVEGRGSATYVLPQGEMEIAMGELLSKLQYPALTNLRIVEHPVNFELTYPSTLPDLFYGEELVVLGRYSGHGEGEVVIEGERAGRTERFTVKARFPRALRENEFLPRLWASRRIGELTRTVRLEGATPERIEEIRELGLRYGILSEYTSYLVQEPVEQVRPEASTGAQAFDASRASARLSAAGSVAEARKAAEQRFEATIAASLESEEVRIMGGRTFRMRDHVWTDAAHGDSLNVITIAPYSGAWFELARALPEIRDLLSESENILVAGQRVSVKVADGGITEWSPGALTRFIRDYRGQ